MKKMFIAVLAALFLPLTSLASFTCKLEGSVDNSIDSDPDEIVEMTDENHNKIINNLTKVGYTTHLQSDMIFASITEAESGNKSMLELRLVVKNPSAKDEVSQERLDLPGLGSEAPDMGIEIPGADAGTQIVPLASASKRFIFPVTASPENLAISLDLRKLGQIRDFLGDKYRSCDDEKCYVNSVSLSCERLK